MWIVFNFYVSFKFAHISWNLLIFLQRKVYVRHVQGWREDIGILSDKLFTENLGKKNIGIPENFIEFKMKISTLFS